MKNKLALSGNPHCTNFCAAICVIVFVTIIYHRPTVKFHHVEKAFHLHTVQTENMEEKVLAQYFQSNGKYLSNHQNRYILF